MLLSYGFKNKCVNLMEHKLNTLSERSQSPKDSCNNLLKITQISFVNLPNNANFKQLSTLPSCTEFHYNANSSQLIFKLMCITLF